MRRRLLSTLLVLCLVLGLLPGTAQMADSSASGTCGASGSSVTWRFDETASTLTISGNGSMEDFSAVYNSRPWADYCEKIKTIIIDRGVTSIGDYAFNGCTGLTSISIPDSIESIGCWAFMYCRNLTSLSIPNNVTSIGQDAFYECEKLAQITLSSGLTKLEEGILWHCSSLKSVKIPNSVTTIGNNAFSGCNSLETIAIPNGVTIINQGAFSECTNLITVKISSDSKLVTIGSGAFMRCSSLKNISLPDGVSKITNEAFSGCKGLETFKIPDGVTYIETGVFAECSNLNSVTIPATVTRIAQGAFSECTGLSDVYYSGSEAQWNQIEYANHSNNAPLVNATKHFNSSPDADHSITLSFDLNGGTGNFASKSYNVGTAITLPAETPRKVDYIFTGWLWNSQTYQPGDTLTADNSNMTFVAQWAEMRTITIDLNGGTPDDRLIPYSRVVAKGSEFEIHNITPTKGTTPFLGWTDGPNIYQPGDKFTVENSVQLKAMWSSRDVPAGAHKLTFHLNGGSAPDGWVDTLYFTAGEGKSIRLPDSAPIKESFDFSGWSFEGATYQAGGQFPAVDRDVVLTAQWEESLVAQRMAYIQNLTQYSLTNATETDKEIIINALYNLMFKAQFRPNRTTLQGDDMVFDGTSMALWPIQNDNANGKSVTDSVLGPVKFAEGGAGCMSYALFATAYIYGTSGVQKCCTNRTTNGIRIFVRQYADPGEQLRFIGNGVHSIVFLGESSDGEGVYCLSYHGGRPDTSSTANDLRVEYRSYASLASRAWSSFTVRDANNGSFYSSPNTVTPISDIRKGAGVTELIGRIACPIEATIRLGDEILESRNPSVASFGNLQRIDDEIVFTLDYNFGYDLEITGTGFGVMTLTLEYYADETLVDKRTIVNLPIEPDTEIQSSAFDPLASFVLYVNPDSAEETAWGVGINETVYAPNNDYSSINNDLGDDSSASNPLPPAPAIPPVSSTTPTSTTNAVIIPNFTGGKVSTSPATASKGTTVTLTATPDEGYELTSLTVTDSKGNELKVADKGDGKYTFTMSDCKVTVNAVFQLIPVQEESQTPWVNPFTDVAGNTWYYDAVEFVSVNGLMNGLSSTMFAPDTNLTRAQLAQILYNKEGKPTVSGSSAFVDVASDAWYTDAVIWAAANGIVGGYGDGRFGPNDNITREQLAIMLWRYAESPTATDKELHFTDADKASGYALEALRWTMENGIINGNGSGILDPKGLATRAQVAQMLKNYLNR